VNRISVVLITKDAAASLEDCLKTLESFDDVTIYDNGSTDNTLDIARSFDNVTVHTGPFLGFGKSKAHAASLAKYDWVFSLDSDEHISTALAEELQHMPLQNTSVYEVRRDNYYNARHIRCCGWYPEYIVRLYNRTKTGFDEAMVHEKVKTGHLDTNRLANPINHFSFHNVSDFLDKIQKYSEIYANEHKGKKDASIIKAVLHGKSMFLKSYLLKGGWKFGFEGFIISFFAGLGTTVKYLKLREKNLYNR